MDGEIPIFLRACRVGLNYRPKDTIARLTKALRVLETDYAVRKTVVVGAVVSSMHHFTLSYHCSPVQRDHTGCTFSFAFFAVVWWSISTVLFCHV